MNSFSNTFDEKLAGLMDHTLLKPEALPSDIEKLCAEARQYHFASVCVQPSYVSLCASLVGGTKVKVCTVIGFPLGTTTTATKQHEAEEALKNGAGELDVVIHVGMLKAGNEQYVRQDIATITESARQSGALVKVILETCLLTDEEKVKACLLAQEAGAHFVKTSTGFSKGGATLEDVQLLRKTVGTTMGVKASGGIRTCEQALAFVQAGATRLGTSSGVFIVTETIESHPREY